MYCLFRPLLQSVLEVNQLQPQPQIQSEAQQQPTGFMLLRDDDAEAGVSQEERSSRTEEKGTAQRSKNKPNSGFNLSVGECTVTVALLPLNAALLHAAASPLPPQPKEQPLLPANV